MGSFRSVFPGATVDWCDKGTQAEHLDTVVKLLRWIADNVVEPVDDGYQPKVVEFSYRYQEEPHEPNPSM
jgi:hypothetical protein